MSQKFECEISSKFKGRLELYLLRRGKENNRDYRLPIKWKNGERFPVNSYKDWLIIKPPHDVDIAKCHLDIRSDIDVDIKYRKKKREWWVGIPFSDDPFGETPITVNVELAPDEDENPDPEPDPSENPGGAEA